MILTGHASLDVAIRSVNNGKIYRFLTKPCSPAELMIAIRQGMQLMELVRESCRILAKTRHQQEVLSKLEATFRASVELIKMSEEPFSSMTTRPMLSSCSGNSKARADRSLPSAAFTCLR